MSAVLEAQVGEQVRRWQPYPAYKKSGIEWLGEIPEHWTLAPLYARYEVQLGKMLDAKRVTGTSLAPCVRNVDVQWDRVDASDLPEMDFNDEERRRLALRRRDGR